MKMKLITVLTIGVSLGRTALSEETGTFVPSLNQLKEIIVIPHHNMSWQGTFYPNGAAKFEGGGSSAKAVAPKKSFSFEQTYALLLPHLRPEQEVNYRSGEDKEFLFVHFCATDKAGSAAFYIRDKDVMRTLMYGLRDKTLPLDGMFSDKDVFESMFAMYPLVPGDEPIPFKYAKYDYKVPRAALEDTGYWQEMEDAMKRYQKARREADGRPEMSPEEERAITEKVAREKAAYILSLQTFAEDEGRAQAPIRPWLYIGILSALCAGAVFWLIRRKRR